MTTDREAPDPRLFSHARRLLKTHENLLRDRARNAAFYEALFRTVTNGSVVLDIGSGTGVWAITAAKLGAKRVVAVERDEMMIGVIRMLAAEQGVADRVEAVWGNSLDLPLEKEFDVVISETIGYFGYEENIVAIMQDARRRFLKDGGVLIPETVSLYAAAGRSNAAEERLPAGLPFEFLGLDRLILNSPLVLHSPADAVILTEPVCLVETDLTTTVLDQPVLNDLKASWEIDPEPKVDRVIIWVESRLTDGVRLSTRETTSWRPVVCRIHPLEPSARTLEFRISLAPRDATVAVVWSVGSAQDLRHYSADLAAAEMIDSARGSGQVSPSEEASVSLRRAEADDEAFLFHLYCEARQHEVAQFGWGNAEIEVFLQMQYSMRERSYAMQFAGVERAIIQFNNENAGSLTIARTESCIELIDIVVSSVHRKKRIASSVIKQLQQNAGEEQSMIRLYVEKINLPALELYQNLGFETTDENDLYYQMQWKPQS